MLTVIGTAGARRTRTRFGRSHLWCTFKSRVLVLRKGRAQAVFEHVCVCAHARASLPTSRRTVLRGPRAREEPQTQPGAAARSQPRARIPDCEDARLRAQLDFSPWTLRRSAELSDGAERRCRISRQIHFPSRKMKEESPLTPISREVHQTLH
ncbi:hypothetical protein OJAV_G00217170 [Oryzias javanicus]|uniref:Uncharacterized protein n=1 Tax=Oryzias javanicus TaxID=123683 RepID=A0A3S2M0C7_ORYJA|nr:hypothetical protein OJAV_G00217170 [Oryzias javanicus]